MENIRRVISYDDVLIVPRRSNFKSKDDCDIVFKYTDSISGIPLINSPMDKVATIDMIVYLLNNNFIASTHRFYSDVNKLIDDINTIKKRLLFPRLINKLFVSVGSLNKWKDYIDALCEHNSNHVHMYGFIVDMANGHTDTCIKTIEYIKSKYSNFEIMAGNVATKNGFIDLSKAGAKFIRVGIGGGSICSTRENTGFGVPTLTSIIDCKQVKDQNTFLVADGGIEHPGDICKAISAGADMVMIGKLLASTSFASGKTYDKNFSATTKEGAIKWKEYSGMASEHANSLIGKTDASVEGVSGLIPYAGTTEKILRNIIQNLKSSVAYYAGCKDWREFQLYTKFIEITPGGMNETKTRVHQQ